MIEMNGRGMHACVYLCVPLRPAGKRRLLVGETSCGITPLLSTL